MSKQGFEFSGFFSAPVEREFFPTPEAEKNKQPVRLMLNLDLLSVETMERIEVEFNEFFDVAVNEILANMGIPTALAETAEPEPEAKPKARGRKIPVAATKPEPSAAINRRAPIELFVTEKTKLKFYAKVLAGGPGDTDATKRLIHNWDVVGDGKPVPISYEILLQMPPHGLKRLYNFCLGEANSPTEAEKKQ